MCGIFGHTGSLQLKKSRTALNKLSHRGPDQWNDWHNENVYLGHRRLSIMDLSENGRQPMVDEQIGVAITVNGEIYNYKYLKAELEGRYIFKSGSDSEILLYGYREWGMDKLLERIEGMYSFALYDFRDNKLFLVRDRVGIKPLYYSLINNEIAWASELKALESYYRAENLSFDYTGVYDYLTYLYIPAPKTLYKDIYKLKPAHYLEFDIATHKISNKAYWKISELGNKNISVKAASKEVKRLVNKAVEEQLMSDVPVGFFLSGGMDSSVVVAAATAFTKYAHTYSIGFDIKEHDETYFAKLVADELKTNHIRKEISVNEVKKQFSNIRLWYDEPFADTSAFPVFKVSKLAKATSTVVLTGDGGDEVFGGYNWYRQFASEYPDRKGLRKWITSKSIDTQLAFYTKLMAGKTHEEKSGYRKKFNIPENYDDYWHFREYYRPDLPVYTRLQFMDFHTYLPGDILTKVDRASMAVALECRVPLLATELVEFMFSLPEHIRYHDGQLKGLMKLAFSDQLPGEIIERNKKGFSIPTGKWRSELMEEKASMPEFILSKLYPELLE